VNARGAAGLLLSMVLAVDASAQTALGHSPNLRGPWTLSAGRMAFVLNHRFEFIEGGDQLLNIPTLTLGVGLPAGLSAGLDFSSNSEVVHDRRGENETQYWLAAGVGEARRLQLDALLAYNSAARSVDGAVTARRRMGGVSILGEARGFSDALGGGGGGFAVAGGVAVHLTPYLELSGDYGEMLRPDTLTGVWSAGVGIAIPGTPHTFTLQATNGGAVTLQGVSRPKVIGPQSVRYGFSFVVPLGSREQWRRIFRPRPATATPTPGVTTRVELRAVAFAPREVRIRAGETVEWINMDPLPHTVTADDARWTSPLLNEGERYVRTFDTPGRYTYHCTPHPQMTGVVIVEP
jgi:plastocyanin